MLVKFSVINLQHGKRAPTAEHSEHITAVPLQIFHNQQFASCIINHQRLIFSNLDVHATIPHVVSNI